MLPEFSNKLAITDIEIKNEILYTVDTVALLEKKYQGYEKHMILGGDQYENFSKWKDYNYILNNVNLHVVVRPNYKINFDDDRIHFTHEINMDISSDFIRSSLVKNGSVDSFVNDEVLNYIKINNLYV